MGVLKMRALLFRVYTRVYIRAPDFESSPFSRLLLNKLSGQSSGCLLGLVFVRLPELPKDLN